VRRAELLRERLFAWYRAARRDLPWRRTSDPYRVWLAEVMLQQTRVEAAIPYYERFLARWPTLEALAAAPEDDVLAAWAGLGYYSRARNLVAAVRECAAKYGGRVPDDPAAFRALRGNGAYTTGAVLSIAFGRPLPAVDGNVFRVLSRLERLEDRRAIEALAASLVPDRGAGEWNQALMELGALVCVPREPRCLACPLADLCEAHRAGVAAEFPPRAKKKARPEAEVSVAIVVRDGAILLERRPPRGLLAGMWAPPAVEGGPEALAGALGVRVRERIAAWRHAFSHKLWDLSAYRCEGRAATRPGRRFLAWSKIDEAGIPSAFRPAVEAARAPDSNGSSPAEGAFSEKAIDRAPRMATQGIVSQVPSS
jgi:A/G-specific adenine glycosylase